MQQSQLVKIVLSADFEKIKERILIELFPNQLLSLEIYKKAEKLLHNKKFLKNARIKDETSLESYYKVMYALYCSNHKSGY